VASADFVALPEPGSGILVTSALLSLQALRRLRSSGKGTLQRARSQTKSFEPKYNLRA
jgi:hypothetical protein